MKSMPILLLILSLVTVAGAQKSVLFLVGAGQEATGPEVSDDIVLDILEAFEWDVETYYLDDPSKMTDSLGLDKDLVVISSTILSTHVGNFYYDKPVPVLTWESGMYAKLGIATGAGNITIQDTFLFITGAGHPAIGDYNGEVEVLLNSPMEVTLVDTSQFSQDVQPLAEMIMDDGSPRTAIFAIEEGATLIDTSAAPARRIGFFFRDKTAEEASDDALAILGLCLKWTMGEEESSVNDLRNKIADYRLFHNYPNPFNPSTTISFSLANAGDVTLTVYNNLGQKVRTLLSAVLSEGQHYVQWHGRDETGTIMPNGVYYYELSSGEGVLRNKMILLK
ncbi:T9SS C-terminal target domain-containing protein [candidate division KSB1 bacterium]|nr:T9SS type A sorting domain-containing protein [candidate division KSB1 bacterium]RQW02855.1 MAG: T9SS C-terminal target domain-containing protein [candidate division KSB1 bacterium]